jgi:hypothetical protein
VAITAHAPTSISDLTNASLVNLIALRRANVADNRAGSPARSLSSPLSFVIPNSQLLPESSNQYAVKVGDLQWVRIPPGQSVARPDVTRAAQGRDWSSLKTRQRVTFANKPPMNKLESITEPTVRSRILPLHLSPAELLWVAQDLPGYPSTFVIRLELSGRFDRPSWESAIGEALERHPLLTAFIRPAKGGLPCWVAAPTSLPPIDWAVEGAPITCPSGEAIDLAHETGLRIWIRLDADRARVLFQFHHACCDGTGAYRFIGDLLACYGAHTARTGRAPVLSPVRLQMLRARSERILDPEPIGLRAGSALAWKIFTRRPAPLAAPRAAKRNHTASQFPAFLSRSLDRETTQSLRVAAIARNATLNDLLIRDLFHALHTWNRRQDSS